MIQTQRYIHNINIASDAVFANRFRSALTALGIIFGVAAVIAMLAIGTGARQEILEQMKLVGVNNIIIRPVFSNENGEPTAWEGKFSPGLTLSDARSIMEIIPTVSQVSPELELNLFGMANGIRKQVKVNGANTGHFELFGLQLLQGTLFSDDQIESGAAVCILSHSVRAVFFGNKNPTGQQIKVGNNWLTVIGVVEDRPGMGIDLDNLGIGEQGGKVFIPVQTTLLRYLDRSAVSATDIQRMRGRTRAYRGPNQESEEKKKSYHQLDRIVVQVADSRYLEPTAEIIQQMLKRRHNDVEDFEVIVPELLLKQEQRAKDIFNIVLGAIAGISLLVGGIGIMNIMLASVMERTREIGIRLAVGAKKSDVVFQFLAESVIISIGGGIIGIMAGVVLARIIMQFTDILTIVTLSSVLISFVVAASIGILFGYMPAREAATKDPVASLRYE